MRTQTYDTSAALQGRGTKRTGRERKAGNIAKKTKKVIQLGVEAPRKRDHAADMDVDSDADSDVGLATDTKPAYELELTAWAEM